MAESAFHHEHWRKGTHVALLCFCQGILPFLLKGVYSVSLLPSHWVCLSLYTTCRHPCLRREARGAALEAPTPKAKGCHTYSWSTTAVANYPTPQHASGLENHVAVTLSLEEGSILFPGPHKSQPTIRSFSERNWRSSSTFKQLAPLKWSSFKLVACCRPSCRGRALSLWQPPSSIFFNRGSRCNLGDRASPFRISAYISPHSSMAAAPAASSIKDQSSQLCKSLMTRKVCFPTRLGSTR